MPEGGGGEEEDAALLFFPQAWTDGGESCPEGTVPVRRTTRRDVLRASSARRFGMKPRARNVRRDSTSSGHEVSQYVRHLCRSHTTIGGPKIASSRLFRHLFYVTLV
jgi:hypothetical protein